LLQQEQGGMYEVDLLNCRPSSSGCLITN